MSLEGDEWKRDVPERPEAFDRHQCQVKLDSDLVEGKITIEKWRDATNILSNLDSNGVPFK